MKQLVEFPLEGGGITFVEVEVEEGANGYQRAARPGEIAVSATQTFETALERIKPAAASLMASLRDLNQPSEISLEFGIKLSAEAGAFIASASTEANFTVQLTWKRPDKGSS